MERREGYGKKVGVVSDLHIQLDAVEVFELFSRMRLERALKEAIGSVEDAKIVNGHLLLLRHILHQLVSTLTQHCSPPTQKTTQQS